MIKRHILFPAMLLIYIVVMAIIAFPNYRESGNWQEFYLILGGSILITFLLFFILKRKQRLRDKFSGKE